MKPASFDYVRALTLDDALQALVAADGGGKVIAGGQSLVPMMNFRLVSPSVLVDINLIEELDFIQELPDGGVRIGALTRHHTLSTSELIKCRYPVLHEAMKHVAHVAIRNRGTIGGSLSHADPAAELPTMTLLLDATIHVISPRGPREIPAAEFFFGPLSADIEEDEIVTQIDLAPPVKNAGWAFDEFSRRTGDFGLAAVGVVLGNAAGRVSEARIGLLGVGDTPLRAYKAEELLHGSDCSEAVIKQVVASVRAFVEPTTDLHASADYRRHLVGVLVDKNVRQAWRRAIGDES